jgi:hypothetical protein
MRKLFLLSLTTALVLGVPWTTPNERALAQRPANLSKLMVQKLDNSKMLLEGIALADFNKITKSAETLIQLSKTAEWFVYKTPRYEVQSNEFRRAAESIVQKAKDKSLDGVTLGYFELTMACVRCHQYVREVRDARVPLPLDPAVTAAAKEMP